MSGTQFPGHKFSLHTQRLVFSFHSVKLRSYNRIIHKDLLGTCTQLGLSIIIEYIRVYKFLGLMDPIFSWGRETINK